MAIETHTPNKNGTLLAPSAAALHRKRCTNENAEDAKIEREKNTQQTKRKSSLASRVSSHKTFMTKCTPEVDGNEKGIKINKISMATWCALTGFGYCVRLWMWICKHSIILNECNAISRCARFVRHYCSFASLKNVKDAQSSRVLRSWVLIAIWCSLNLFFFFVRSITCALFCQPWSLQSRCCRVRTSLIHLRTISRGLRFRSTASHQSSRFRLCGIDLAWATMTWPCASTVFNRNSRLIQHWLCRMHRERNRWQCDSETRWELPLSLHVSWHAKCEMMHSGQSSQSAR